MNFSQFWLCAEPGCPKDKVVFVSTEIWDPILLFLENLEKGEQTSEQESLFNALQKTSKKDFVLVAHSYGGAIAIELMNGMLYLIFDTENISLL